MQFREEQYFNRTNEKVYFGVGALGNDPGIAGFCYRITIPSVDRDLIVQVITASSPSNDFELIIGDGGLGSSSACTEEGTFYPQYSSSSLSWGDIFSGPADISQCDQLPTQPMCATGVKDNLQDLCSWSFRKGKF